METIAGILREWAEKDEPHKLVITLEHHYTQKGLSWDTLKGVDRAWADVLRKAARQADCQAHLALLTLHESGSAVDDGNDYGYGYGGRWDDEEDEDEDEEDEEDAEGDYEMEEVFESSLTADHWVAGEGAWLPTGEIEVEEDELLDPDALRDVKPEEEFEGYTGNEGMTLDRWYRHGAIILWPTRKSFDVLCDAGNNVAIQALEKLVKQGQKASKKHADALRTSCLDFAATIIARWPESTYGGPYDEDKSDPLSRLLAELDDLKLLKAYLGVVMTRDGSIQPHRSLIKACTTHGWKHYKTELDAIFSKTTTGNLLRNVGLLEAISQAKPRQQEEWLEVCQAAAQSVDQALESIDQEAKSDWRAQRVDRKVVLTGLTKALLASKQADLLSRLVAQVLARPQLYPLREVHEPTLTGLQAWLAKNVKQSSPGLSEWVAACCLQLEELTAQAPQPPTDYRRAAPISCKCAHCAELKRFLEDPGEREHRFRAVQGVRTHLEDAIRHTRCDLGTRTERIGSPHTLVCTKNTASYQEKRKTFQQDQERLAALQAIQQSLPK